MRRSYWLFGKVDLEISVFFKSLVGTTIYHHAFEANVFVLFGLDSADVQGCESQDASFNSPPLPYDVPFPSCIA